MTGRSFTRMLTTAPLLRTTAGSQLAEPIAVVEESNAVLEVAVEDNNQVMPPGLTHHSDLRPAEFAANWKKKE